VLHEVYEQVDAALRGKSFSTYDAPHRQWHQSWVTNHGALLLLDGGWDGSRMVLAGTERAADGTSSLLRGIWRAESSAVRRDGRAIARRRHDLDAGVRHGVSPAPLDGRNASCCGVRQ